VVTRRGATCLPGLVLSATAGFAQPAAAPPASDAAATLLTRAQGQRVLQQARAAHYSLRGAGMDGLSCKVQPDWEAFYQQMKVNSVGRTRLLPMLRSVQLNVVVAADGSDTVTHHPEVAATVDPDLAASARSSLADIENTVHGFLLTWSSLAVDTPLPQTQDDYQVQALKGKYRVNYTESPAVVHSTIGADFAVEELVYAAPGLAAVTIHPSWTRLPGGFLLSGYEGQSQLSMNAHLIVKIDNHPVDGLQLPSTVRFSDGPEELRFRFSDCLVKKRPP
jgi:hypothetical protein